MEKSNEPNPVFYPDHYFLNLNLEQLALVSNGWDAFRVGDGYIEYAPHAHEMTAVKYW